MYNEMQIHVKRLPVKFLRFERKDLIELKLVNNSLIVHYIVYITEWAKKPDRF